MIIQTTTPVTEDPRFAEMIRGLTEVTSTLAGLNERKVHPKPVVGTPGQQIAVVGARAMDVSSGVEPHYCTLHVTPVFLQGIETLVAICRARTKSTWISTGRPMSWGCSEAEASRQNFDSGQISVNSDGEFWFTEFPNNGASVVVSERMTIERLLMLFSEDNVWLASTRDDLLVKYKSDLIT